MNHSIPDAVAFAIDSPAGTIIQTGDFKIDYTPLACGPTDLATLSEYGQKGVLALLSDSTNAERPGFTATEQKVAAGVRSLFARAQNKRIIIATFASNIYRVQQIIDLAVEDGRKVAFSGRSMVNNTAMAQELGYMHIPEGTLISIDEINQYPPEQVVLVTTGSQGEPLSALSRMASCSHRQVRVGPGDFIIISAKPIPGNEKSVTKIVNGLLLLGAEVIYEGMYDVHVSGHACQEEQKLMLTLTRPKYFLPVHGEYKQLKKHAITAASLGIPTSNILIAENGSNIILSQDEMKLGEPVTAGAVMVDGLGVGDVGNVVLRDRKHLSEDGLVIIVATVDSKTGKVLAGPDLVSRGFVYVRENESLMDGAQSIVETALDRCVDEHVRDWNSVKTRVREALSSYIYRRTKRSPMILPHPDGGLSLPAGGITLHETKNQDGLLKVLTAALAVLCWPCWCSVLLVQRPAIWPVLVVLAVLWFALFGVFRYRVRSWVARWVCGGSFAKIEDAVQPRAAEPACRPPFGGDGAVVQHRVPYPSDEGRSPSGTPGCRKCCPASTCRRHARSAASCSIWPTACGALTAPPSPARPRA